MEIGQSGVKCNMVEVTGYCKEGICVLCLKPRNCLHRLLLPLGGVCYSHKMAPVCSAARRSRQTLLVLLFAVILFICVCCPNVSAILIYDRQTLLNIRSTAETELSRHDLADWTASLPPLLADIPAYRRRTPCAPPWKKRRRRRGKRAGVLVKIKAYLSSSCVFVPRLRREGLCFSSAIRCSLQFRCPWIRAVAPSPPAGASERTFSPGPPTISPPPGLLPTPSYFSPGLRLAPSPLLLPAASPGPPMAPAFHAMTTALPPGHHRARRGGVVFTNLCPLRRAAASATVTPQVTLKIALINARSLANKTFLLNDFFTSRELDFMCLTETWIHAGESIAFSEILPPGCTFLSSPRTTGKGGGVACVYKSSFHCRQIPSVTFSSFELQLFELNCSPPMLFAVVYRPPKYNKEFIQDFENFLSLVMVDYEHVLIQGDLNIHVCCETKPLVKDFLSLIDSFNLTQWVSGPTHEKGHTLDLVLSLGVPVHVDEICSSACISDHLPVLFSATVPCSVVETRPAARRYRVINSDTTLMFSMAFDECVISSMDELVSLCPEELVAFFDLKCSSILDSIAPIKKKSVKALSEPWINDSIRALRRSCRRAERKWKKDKLYVFYGIMRDCLLEYQNAVKAAKAGYLSNLVSNNIDRPKVLFNVLDSLVNPCTTDPIVPSPALCNDFLEFFVNKISALRSVPPLVASDPSGAPLCPAVFDQFKPIPLSELLEVVQKLRPTSSPSDSIPPRLLKKAFYSVGSFILLLLHTCFSSACFPAPFKHAIVQPLIKKPSLDPSILANFRPISKLPFLSKVLEKVMASQLVSFLEKNSICEKFQSGFRPRHSTESALLRVFNDLILTVDSGCAAIMVTLDLTAAFDTVDHRTLLSRLEQYAGIKGAALTLLQSYLTDRTFSVHLGDVSSSVTPLTCGVPQGSILGPLLFTLYMLPLGSIFRKHNVSFHCYADDVQIYLPLQMNCNNSVQTLLACISDIKTWMSLSFLNLNDSKTEVTVFGHHKHFSDCADALPPSLCSKTVIKSLGVIFDSDFKFDRQIGYVVKSAFFQLRLLASVKPYLSPTDLEKVIHAFISSRLDYCNSLYVGLDQRSLRRLQLVQNAAARLLTGTKKREHISPVLASLHWLPVRFRIDFKILMFVLKS